MPHRKRAAQPALDDDGKTIVSSYMDVCYRPAAPRTPRRAFRLLSRPSAAAAACGGGERSPRTPRTPRREAAADEGWGGGGGWQAIAAAAEAEGGEAEAREQQLRQLLGGARLAEALGSRGFLRACLRAKKYEPAKAAALMQAYDAFRTAAGWPPPSVSAAGVEAELRTGFNMLLPCVDVYGYTVYTQTMARLDLRLPHASMERYQKMGYYLLHRGLRRRVAQTHGVALLLDFAGFSFGHLLRRVRLSDLRRGIDMLQDCFPAHLECIYIAHAPSWLERLLSMIRNFLRKDTLKKKLIFLGNEGLAAHFATERLPKELGGELEFDWQAQVDEWLREEAALDCASLDIASWIAEGACIPQQAEARTAEYCV
ncbi:hypothetical protein AB1Y20_005960 [Prymnesium parvum]|uniref:CRAL-TRIO domain-containing protein n=1 Tax=Prymnesium parvum TaxID=97485 RepID=A0AB34J1W1_PRYPA